MPQITVTINGHPHAVQCDPGEEHRIRELARLVEAKVATFGDQAQRVGEARLLVLAALVLADELTEGDRQSAPPGGGAPRPAPTIRSSPPGSIV